jgi:hypothetical protein
VKKFFVHLLLGLTAAAALCTAQQSTRGREFVVAFLPNYHAASSTGDSLYITIVASVPTTGTLELRDRSGNVVPRSFSITNPTQILTLSLSPALYELRGYNYREAFTTTNDIEKASPASIRIIADNDVSVYALNKAVRSSDATLILPLACLGTEYVVLSAKSETQSAFPFPGLSTSSTPSQFCVVASSDNTNVTITPSTATFGASVAVQNIVLQKGESYLVQGQFTTDNGGGYDLSGSIIRSSKPVAVFGGHQRARVGITSASASRDHLYEQLLPLSVWGTRYVLTPFVQPRGGWTTGSDKYRVIACADSTEVRVNGSVVARLKANAFFEGDITTGALIRSTKKVMVAQYKKTAGLGTTDPGDPFMMVIPPRRQYGTSYRVSTVQAGGVYTQHFLTVTIITADLPTLRVDGSAVSVPGVEVPNSCFSYVSIPVAAGAHTVSARSPIGLYVYGYGDADSYGYVGGMEFIPDVQEQTVDAGADRTVCPGTPTVLTLRNGVSSIRWSPSSVLSCDTCAQTTARVQRTTTFVVSGADSLGCVSSDTVVLSVRKLPATYALRSAALLDMLSIPVGAQFRLAVQVASPAWDTLRTTRIRTTITYDPLFMGPSDAVTEGPSLPQGWRAWVVDSLSDEDRGVLVVDAAGDSALKQDGVVLWLGFVSRLSEKLSSRPSITMQLSSNTADCSVDQGSGMTIQLAACAESIRKIQLMEEPITLHAVRARRGEGNAIEFVISAGFDADVQVKLYDLHGSCVATLCKEYMPAGEHSFRFTLPSIAPGVYAVVAGVEGYCARRVIYIP